MAQLFRKSSLIISLLLNVQFLALNSQAQLKPELRAVWVATVDNIDWPSSGNYNTDSQKTQFIHLLEMQQSEWHECIDRFRYAHRRMHFILLNMSHGVNG